MRIGLFLPHLAVTGGLGVHCRSLLAALLRTGADDALTVFAPADPRRLFPKSGLDDTWEPLAADPRVTLVPLDWPAARPLAHALDPVLAGPLAAAKPDVFLASYYSGLERPPCPQAVVFHDAGFLDSPEVFGDTARQRREMFEAVRPAVDVLVCVSDDARQRICRLLPFDPARTAVVWHALADDQVLLRQPFAPGEADKPLWAGGDRAADWGAYLFSPVGAATGFNRVRKNLPTAVAGFRQLARPGVKLVIASTGLLHDDMLAELLPASELAGGRLDAGAWRSADGALLILPNLDRGPFLTAMAHAKAVVYPSRYEGFGLPTIEAMALGVPVVASRATSIPEVVGDAGLLVDPDDAAGFAAAIRRVLDDPNAVADLVRKGRERAGAFTLERMGEAMREVFRGMAGGERGA